MSAKVSVVLPTRNSIRYLKERIDSIRNQTLRDIEIIVVDTASTDGTFEALRNWANEDRRVRIYDVPPGLYGAFNFGIRKASGEYVYIATSDDTMRCDALERMAAALDAHPDCDICDSPIMQIDEVGRELREGDSGYYNCSGHFLYPREKMHIRRRPVDLIQQLGGKNVYISQTELLVRRSLYEKTGFFPEDMGFSADFMWDLRASSQADVVYLPIKLATWRLHPGQATGTGMKRPSVMNRAQMAILMAEEMAGQKCRYPALLRLAKFKDGLVKIKETPGALKVLSAVRLGMRHPLLMACFLVGCVRGATDSFDGLYRLSVRRYLDFMDIQLLD